MRLALEPLDPSVVETSLRVCLSNDHFYVAVLGPLVVWSVAWLACRCKLTAQDFAWLVAATAANGLFAFLLQEPHGTHLIPMYFVLQLLFVHRPGTPLPAVKTSALSFVSMILPDALIPLPSVRAEAAHYLEAVVRNLPCVGYAQWLDGLVLSPLMVLVGLVVLHKLHRVPNQAS